MHVLHFDSIAFLANFLSTIDNVALGAAIHVLCLSLAFALTHTQRNLYICEDFHKHIALLPSLLLYYYLA